MTRTLTYRRTRGLGGWLLLTAFLGLFGAAGCATPGTYYERHEIPRLTVVFLDEQSLQDKWTLVTSKSPIMSSGVVVGLFDFRTQTIYCPKMDFEVCGHELHHAVLGRFHPED
ncbi:MAG: hypothetical protein HY581_10755 [Nitrospirae bacterium]|nr:hypothetical protein [Nitrospirota bacterium]